MQYKLLISPTAFSETDDAFIYYENESPGLGERFLNSVDDTYTKISSNPWDYGFLNSNKDLRDVRIKDFPFVIIFQINVETVLVLRVFNTRRNPLSLKYL